MHKNCFRTSAALLLLGGAASAFSIEIGQIDTFEDGTTQGWVTNLLGQGNPPNPPTNVSTGGPGGAGDNYLSLTSLGTQGPGGKLVGMNVSQWSGDYTDEGVTSITMQVKNFGDTDLNLRLLFESVGQFGPTDVAATTDSFFLAAGSDWTTVQFDVTPSALTPLLGDVNNALSNVSALRIYNSADLTFPGPNSVSSLGVDNMQAVPEPGTIMATLAGLGFLARKRRKASR